LHVEWELGKERFQKSPLNSGAMAGNVTELPDVWLRIVPRKT
jgi:hypothetical protein